jgi:hypothetical protein
VQAVHTGDVPELLIRLVRRNPSSTNPKLDTSLAWVATLTLPTFSLAEWFGLMKSDAGRLL